MTVTVKSRPLVLPARCSPHLSSDLAFGAIISGCDPANLSPGEFDIVQDLLYKHGVIVWEDVDMDPVSVAKVVKLFDPSAMSYGHVSKSRPDVKPGQKRLDRSFPAAREVQLLGSGYVDDDKVLQGIEGPTTLRHPQHHDFHREVMAPEREAQGLTRFFRWHIDAALYDVDPPKVTALYAVKVPRGKQTIVYDDGTDDQIVDAPKAGTAFISGRRTFDILPDHLKSLAVRATVHYTPHPYAWISLAKARSTGLGMLSEGKELAMQDLPEYDEAKIKRLPMLWKNPVTGALHFQVHAPCVQSITVAPLPEGVEATKDTLYASGTTINDLAEVRELLNTLQRPGISPENVVVYDWKERDFVVFGNRQVMHAVTGTYHDDKDVRALYQCNMAASEPVLAPTADDIQRYA